MSINSEISLLLVAISLNGFAKISSIVCFAFAVSCVSGKLSNLCLNNPRLWYLFKSSLLHTLPSVAISFLSLLVYVFPESTILSKIPTLISDFIYSGCSLKCLTVYVPIKSASFANSPIKMYCSVCESSLLLKYFWNIISKSSLE